MTKNILYIMMLTFILIISGCGNENDKINNTQQNSPSKENAKDESISVTDLEGQTTQFNSPPKRIIALSAGDLETIYALGGEVVGRPIIRGEIPEDFKDIPEIGTSKEINMEKIISLDPDLVIAHPELNANEIPTLEGMGIDVMQTGADNIKEIQASIQMFGNILQKENEAKILNENINQKIEALHTDEELRTLLVFGVPGTLMVALSDTLSGDVLEASGGYNIAKDFPELDDYPGYAQLEMEKILEADPEVIFLVTPGPPELAKESLNEEIEKNPAWKSVTAVKNDHIVQLPNTLFGANPGAKVVESLDYLHQKIEFIQNEH